MANRVLEIVLGANRRKLRKDLRNAKKDIHSFAGDTRRKLRSSFRDAFGTIAGVGSVAGLAAIGKNVLDVDKKLTRLGIQAGRGKAEMVAFGAGLRELSNETGVSTESLTDAAARFVSLTGDMDSAAAGAEVFAKTAAASGAQLEDVAAAAASLNKNLGIESVQGFNKGLSVLLEQGKQGAVELKEMAGLLPSLAPSFTQFGKSGTEGLAELGAALQVVRGGFGSGSEAATGMNALMTALAKNAGRFKGVKLFDKDPKTGARHFRQFKDIILDISKSKLMKDPEKLQKAFGSNEARRAFQELAKNYGQFEDLYAKGLASNANEDDFARYMESTAGRIEKAWQRLQNTLAEQITPERIEALASAFEKLADGVEFVVDNLALFVGAFAALKLAKWTMRLTALARSMAGVKNATGALADAGGVLGTRGTQGIGKFASALSRLGSIASVGLLAYQLGTLADQALGLSDSISDALSGKSGKDHTGRATRFDPTGKADSDRKFAAQIRDDLAKSETVFKNFGVDQNISAEKLRELERGMQSAGLLSRDTSLLNPKEAAAHRAQAAQLEQRANVRETIERIKQTGAVDIGALPASGAVSQKTQTAVAAQVIKQLGSRGQSAGAGDPQMQALLRAVLAELQRERRVELKVNDQALAAVIGNGNQVGRAPSP